MIKYNSHEARLNFSKIMLQIANGKDIIITRSGQDFAQITPLKKNRPVENQCQEKQNKPQGIQGNRSKLKTSS